MSSPEEPSKETTAPKADPANEPEDSGTQPAAGAGTAPGTGTTGTGEGAGGSEQPPPSDAKPGERGPGDQSSDEAEAELPELSPIPPSGTSAPADSGRVFGRPSSTFPQQPGGAPTPAGPGAGWQRTTSSGMRQQTPTAAPTEEDLKKVRNRGRLALALGIMALLALLLFPLGLFLGIAAIVFGIIARRLGRRAGTVAAGAVPGIVLGIVSTMISLVIGVTVAVFWQEFTTYTTCIEGANTHTAQNKCRSELEGSLQERLLTETR